MMKYEIKIIFLLGKPGRERRGSYGRRSRGRGSNGGRRKGKGS